MIGGFKPNNIKQVHPTVSCSAIASESTRREQVCWKPVKLYKKDESIIKLMSSTALLSHIHGPTAFLCQNLPSSFCRECVCCLLVLNTVTSTPQWIRQPEAAWLCVWCLCAWCLCVSMCSDILGTLSLWTSGYASSGTLAFSLRLMPPRPAADAALTHTGSSGALHPALLPFHGPISFTFLPRPGLHYIHLQWQLCNLINDSLRNLTKKNKPKRVWNSTQFSHPSLKHNLVIQLGSTYTLRSLFTHTCPPWHVPDPCPESLPPFDFAPRPSVRSRPVTPCPAPQVGASLASDE